MYLHKVIVTLYFSIRIDPERGQFLYVSLYFMGAIYGTASKWRGYSRIMDEK